MSIQTTIDFLADLPLYEEEKPYYLHASAAADDRLDVVKITNIEWDTKPVTVHSMRDNPDLDFEKNGFCYVKHESKCPPHPAMGLDHVERYRQESEALLRDLFQPEFVLCYDYKLRKNAPHNIDRYDPSDPFLVEQAAKGAHVFNGIHDGFSVDISLDHVPHFVKGLVTEEQLGMYFKPGYRFRLINMWRSTLPECEDRPLALCDYTSIDPADLIPTDRVYPNKTQEIYHLRYNKQQRWYWLPNQRSDEPFLFKTFDSKPDSGARYCPHISIPNPLAGPQAPPRESVETRNLVITKA